MLVAVVTVLLLATGSQGFAQPQQVNTAAAPPIDADWPAWGHSNAGTRYSALSQINASNVNQLKQAWTFRFDPPTLAPGSAAALQGTPLKIGETLYFCDSRNIVRALDAETGTLRWTFDPHVNLTGVAIAACRGVSYFRVTDGIGDCTERIIATTLDARLFAVDVRTGRPCPGFGHAGMVDLTEGVIQGRALPLYSQTSAPTVAGGKIVVGGLVLENQFVDEPSGVVRAFDAVTGKLAWAWDADRAADAIPNAAFHRGTPNAWAPMSADETLGLVYVPTGNTMPNHWGGYRSNGTERYASSVVELDLNTGQVRWSFQTTHHDLWDYDVSSQPTLVDLPRPGGALPVLIQLTKLGQVFVLDRRDGHPISPVSEKPVPEGAAPGDRVSPTQPFSIGMPQFDGPPLDEKMMWGLTPFDQLWCRIEYMKTRYDGLYTPPGLKPTIVYPGNAGGFNWGSASIDTDRNLMVVEWLRVPTRMQLIPRVEADRAGMKVWAPYDGQPIRSSPQMGTPYAVLIRPFASPLDVPCIAPPYGLIAAVDLTTGKLKWTKRLGTMEDSGPMGVRTGLPLTIGTPFQGGALVTHGGLVLIGATQERSFRAIDINTGEILWKDRLPTGAHATPMTYYSQKSGRQFIVVAVGGSTKLKNSNMGLLVAYALPNDARSAR